MVDTVYGVVGLEPANDGLVDAWTEAMVPILKCAKSSNLDRSLSSTYNE